MVKLNGINALSYVGVKPLSVPLMIIKTTRPTVNDVMNFDLGTLWVIPKKKDTAPVGDPSQEVWILLGNAQNTATWKDISAFTPSDIEEITGNSGSVVVPDDDHNINIFGDSGITTTGNNDTSTITVSGSSSSVTLNIQVFTTPGADTYTPTAGMIYCIVECVGGGGGAGNAFHPYFTTGSGAGGAGAYCRKVLSAAAIGASQPYVIGNAGSGVLLRNGMPGGDTTFGSILSAGGGSGGTSGVVGGSGGVASGGDVNMSGQPGGYGNDAGIQTGSGFGGRGGSSVYGFGGPGNTTNSSGVGVNAVGYGGGGGGSFALSGVRLPVSASGSAGIIIITEYIS